MKLKLLYILGILLLMLAFPRCKPDDKPVNPTHYYFWLGEAKDYMHFKRGSWWVYLNTENGQIDTLECISSNLDTGISHGTEKYSKDRIYTYESTKMTLYSHKFDIHYTYYCRPKSADVNHIPTIGSFTFYKTKYPARVGEVLRFPLTIKEMIEPDGGGHVLQRVKDTTMVIQGRIYTNVQIIRNYRMSTFDYLLNPNPDYTPSYIECYYAPSYGLVKMTEPKENRNIELLHSYIIQ